MTGNDDTDAENRNPRSWRPVAFDYPTLKGKTLRGWINADHKVEGNDAPPIHIPPEDTGYDSYQNTL